MVQSPLSPESRPFSLCSAVMGVLSIEFLEIGVCGVGENRFAIISIGAKMCSHCNTYNYVYIRVGVFHNLRLYSVDFYISTFADPLID